MTWCADELGGKRGDILYLQFPEISFEDPKALLDSVPFDVVFCRIIIEGIWQDVQCGCSTF